MITAEIKRPVRYVPSESIIVDAEGRGVVEMVDIYGMSFTIMQKKAEEIVRAINNLSRKERNTNGE